MTGPLHVHVDGNVLHYYYEKKGPEKQGPYCTTEEVTAEVTQLLALGQPIEEVYAYATHREPPPLYRTRYVRR